MLDPTHDPATGELSRWTVYENGLVPAEYSSFSQEVYRNLGKLFANYQILQGLQFRSEWDVDPENGDALFYTDDTKTETTNRLSAAANQAAGNPNPDC